MKDMKLKVLFSDEQNLKFVHTYEVVTFHFDVHSNDCGELIR